MRKYWILPLWLSQVAGILLLLWVASYIDGNIRYILAVFIVSVFIALPTVYITGCKPSAGTYFVLVSAVLWFLSILLSVVVTWFLKYVIGEDAFSAVGGVTCWFFCYSYDRIFLDRHSLTAGAINFGIGYVLWMVAVHLDYTLLNPVGFFLAWSASVGICVTISLYRHLNGIKRGAVNLQQ